MTSKRDAKLKRRLTPKQRVLKVWPKANAYQWRDSWTIYSGDYLTGNTSLGNGITAALAWNDAARNNEMEASDDK